MKAKYKRDMSMLAFFNQYYIPHFRERNGHTIGDNYEGAMRRLFRVVAEITGESPKLQHFSDEHYAALIARVPKGQSHHYRQLYCKLWRLAASMGFVDLGKAATDFRGTSQRKGRKIINLNEAESTENLWQLCLAKFFPSNLRIRTEKTKHQYAIAIRSYARFLDRLPILEDLDEDKIVAWMTHLSGQGLAAKTINERRGRICTLWTWLAKKGIVKIFPTVGKIKEPRRTPRAWTISQLEQLLCAIRQMKGNISKSGKVGISKADFWLCLHLVLWDTGARIGEIMAARWKWLDAENGFLDIPAEVRKGQSEDMCYSLHPQTVVALDRLRRQQFDHGSTNNSLQLIFDWPYSESMLYSEYRNILVAAGLPSDSTCKFHRMRRSVASHLQAAGHDACAVLHHSSPEVTKKSYLDPHIIGAKPPSAILDRIDLPRLEGPNRKSKQEPLSEAELSAERSRMMKGAMCVQSKLRYPQGG